jgi:hypothetical protein
VALLAAWPAVVSFPAAVVLPTVSLAAVADPMTVWLAAAVALSDEVFPASTGAAASAAGACA